MLEYLSQKFKTILEGNTLIQEVFDYEASNISGSPCATITPSGNANDYHSTTENHRRYSFVIRLYIRRGSQSSDEKTTESAMRQLVDTVLDDLDKNHQLSGLGTQTGYIFLFMRAAPSQWGYAGRELEMRVAEINITVDFHVDVTAIS